MDFKDLYLGVHKPKVTLGSSEALTFVMVRVQARGAPPTHTGEDFMWVGGTGVGRDLERCPWL